MRNNIGGEGLSNISGGVKTSTHLRFSWLYLSPNPKMLISSGVNVQLDKLTTFLVVLSWVFMGVNFSN